MKRTNENEVKEIPLPFSNGLLSAKLWKANNRYVAGVPELGLTCFGESDTEASFRLFTTLVKYFRQLKANKSKLKARGLDHLAKLTRWMDGVEARMAPAASENNLVSLANRRLR